MKAKEINLLEYFSLEEGINLRYGRPGHGKTSTASIEIRDRLMHGSVEYANWKIKVEDYDETKSYYCMFMWFIGFKSEFTIIRCSKNLYYFELDDEWARQQSTPDQKYEDFNDWFASRTDCVFNVDEGHLLLDSYLMAKQSLKQRAAVLHTRHFSRTINVISQRPTAIHVTARGNVESFIKCEQIIRSRPLRKFILRTFGWTFIRIVCFQDMIGETVDEESVPEWTKWHWLTKRNSIYDSKYLRKGLAPSQTPNITVYETETWDRYKFIKNVFSSFLGQDRGQRGALAARGPSLQTTNNQK